MSVTTTYSQSHEISRERGIIKQAAAGLRSIGRNLMSELEIQFVGLNNVYQNTPNLPLQVLANNAGSVLFLP